MKIGFIAMSGVRAWDPELLELGLSMPGFVERKEVIAQLPSLGLLTLAGLTPLHDDISYHEIFDFSRDLPPKETSTWSRFPASRLRLRTLTGWRTITVKRGRGSSLVDYM